MSAPTYGELLHAARAVVLQTMPGDPPPEHAMDLLRAVVARWEASNAQQEAPAGAGAWRFRC